MPNLHEITERLLGVKIELDAVHRQKSAEELIARQEEQKQANEQRKAWEDRQTTLKRSIGPILESVNETLLNKEGFLRQTSDRDGNPSLELMWGSQYEMGGPKPTHRIAAIHLVGTKFRVEFGWYVNVEIFNIDKRDWENDLIESIRVAFKEEKCSESPQVGDPWK